MKALQVERESEQARYPILGRKASASQPLIISSPRHYSESLQNLIPELRILIEWAIWIRENRFTSGRIQGPPIGELWVKSRYRQNLIDNILNRVFLWLEDGARTALQRHLGKY